MHKQSITYGRPLVVTKPHALCVILNRVQATWQVHHGAKDKVIDIGQSLEKVQGKSKGPRLGKENCVEHIDSVF